MIISKAKAFVIHSHAVFGITIKVSCPIRIFKTGKNLGLKHHFLGSQKKLDLDKTTLV